MKSATALTLVAIGAIFAFAVTAHPSFVNIQVLGWVLMLTGIVGLVIPRRGRGWLRRSVLMKGSPDITKTAEADSRNPITPSTSAESAPTVRSFVIRSPRSPRSSRPGLAPLCACWALRAVAYPQHHHGDVVDEIARS